MQLTVRNTDTELMDDPNLDIQVLKNFFKDINRANAILGGNKGSLDAIWNIVKEDTKKTYTILDVGCGDGYILRKSALFLRKKNINVQLIGLDIREDILSIAKEASVDFPEISYLKQDVLLLDPENHQCDILLCTLTMHHFNNDEILVFLKKFVSISKNGIIINDLQRSKIACSLFKLFRLFFLKTDITKKDGLTSIKSGFLLSELKEFSKNIPNVTHKIAWKWAFRYIWVMRTN